MAMPRRGPGRAESIRADAEARRDSRRGGWGRPLPFQFQIPLGGGPLGIALPLGGYASPFAFTIPLGAPTTTVVVPPPAAPVPSSPPAPVTVATPDDDLGRWVLDVAEAWQDDEAGWETSADLVESLLAGLDPGGAPGGVPGPRLGAVTIFRNVAVAPDRPLPPRIAGRFDVLARPGGAIGGVVLGVGDLVIRVARGEGWGGIGVVASPGAPLPHDRLTARGLRFEGYPRLEPGLYAHVVEPGPQRRAATDRFCRRIADPSGLLRGDTLLLRPRRGAAAAAQAGEAAEGGGYGEGGPAYPCEGDLSAFGRAGRAGDLRAGRRSRPQRVGGRPLCPGEHDLVVAGPGGPVDLLIWNFDIDGSYTKSAHEAALDRLIAEVHGWLRGPSPNATAVTIHLSGFASRTGNLAYNAALATAREATAEAYLRANMEKFAAPSEAPILPAVTFVRNPGGFDPAAPPAAESAHARSARVVATASGTPPPPPRPFPTTIPPELRGLLDAIGRVLRALPGLSALGVVPPADARLLTSAEQAEAMTVYGGSLDFTKIVITDGLGAGGRPFTVAVPTSIGWFVALNQGPGAIAKDWSARPDSVTLVHELGHAWQSQHARDHTAFMVASIRTQGLAVARTEAERATAFAAAFAAWQLSHPFDIAGARAAGSAAAAGICFDPYAYVPGRPFTEYGVEQVAQIAENAYLAGRLATDSIVAHLRGVAPNLVDADNEATLTGSRHERRGAPGVVSETGACPGVP